MGQQQQQGIIVTGQYTPLLLILYVRRASSNRHCRKWFGMPGMPCTVAQAVVVTSSTVRIYRPERRPPRSLRDHLQIRAVVSSSLWHSPSLAHHQLTGGGPVTGCCHWYQWQLLCPLVLQLKCSLCLLPGSTCMLTWCCCLNLVSVSAVRHLDIACNCTAGSESVVDCLGQHPLLCGQNLLGPLAGAGWINCCCCAGSLLKGQWEWTLLPLVTYFSEK